MRIALRVATVVLLWAGTCRAHEHWILVEQRDGQATIRIGSGHGFPASEFLLAQRLLADTVVVGPGGTATAFAPEARGLTWTADAAFGAPGVWIASFALRKPRVDEALYAGRSLTVVGGRDDTERYATGQGLELVPMAPLATLKPGDTLPVAIHLDGTPVAGRIAVQPERGAVAFLSTGKDRPAEIRCRAAGAYLLTVARQGKTFALTFSVAPPAAGVAAP